MSQGKIIQTASGDFFFRNRIVKTFSVAVFPVYAHDVDLISILFRNFEPVCQCFAVLSGKSGSVYDRIAVFKLNRFYLLLFENTDILRKPHLGIRAF